MSEYVRITDRKIEMTDEGVEALMSDYTPTTEEVRDCYTSQKMFNDAPDAEFDRWLFEHDRQLSERVWEEGMYAGRADDYFGNPDSPYRQGETE